MPLMVIIIVVFVAATFFIAKLSRNIFMAMILGFISGAAPIFGALKFGTGNELEAMAGEMNRQGVVEGTVLTADMLILWSSLAVGVVFMLVTMIFYWAVKRGEKVKARRAAQRSA